MEQGSFPKQEHIDYIVPRAQERISQSGGLEYVDVVPDTPTHKRVYLVGIRMTGIDQVMRLEVPFQVIERCQDCGSDTELVQLLDSLLDETFH